MSTIHSSEESPRARSRASTVLLFLGMGLLLFATSAIIYNAFESSPRASTLEEIKMSVIDTSQATHVDEQDDGHVIFTAGELKSEDVVDDRDFDLHVSAIRLHRTVEIYQVVEKTEEATGSERQQLLRQGLPTTTTYYYQAWVDAPLDSSSYAAHYRHVNQESHLSYESTTWQAPQVTLGIYKLSADIVSKLQLPTQVVDHRKLQLPDNLKNRVYWDDDYLYLRSRDLSKEELRRRESILPHTGDLRLRWYVELADSPWSLIARQQGNTLVPFSSSTEQHITISHPSITTCKQLLRYSSNQEGYSKKTLRLGAFFLLWLAYCLMTKSMLAMRPQSYFWIGFTERFKLLSSLILSLLTVMIIFAASALRSDFLFGVLMLAFSLSLAIFIRLISISKGRSILRDQAARSALPRSLRY